MIGIEINNEFLDLPATIQLEIVRNSPYLNNDEIEGEYALPIAIPYSDNNYKILSYTGNHYKTHTKEIINATLIVNGSVKYPGTLVIDGWEKNNNNPKSLSTKGIFTFSISSFFQQIKDKKLTDLTLGGTRTFSWTTNNPYDASNGFWQHLHSIAATPGDYTFVPIYNEGYGTIPGNIIIPSHKKMVWMNKLDMDNQTQLYFAYHKNAVTLTPSIKLNYVIKQLFEQFGWDIDGDIFSDSTFNKLYLQSFKAVYWCNYSTTSGALITSPLSTININLGEHMPPDYSIQNFIIDLKNRYGLAFIFDIATKKCSVKFLKNIANNATSIDLTKYAGAGVKSKFDKKIRVVGLQNNIDGADSYPTPLNAANLPTIPAVLNTAALPAVAGYDEGTFCYVFLNNSYYEIVTNDAGTKEWQIAGDNIGDYLPIGYTETLDTNISTIPSTYIKYRTMFGFTDYYGFFPTCNQLGNWYQNKEDNPFGLRTILCYGLQNDVKEDGTNAGSVGYPYASAHSTDNFGNELTTWSNVYERQYSTINNGIYKTWFTEWIKFYKQIDERTYVLKLPFYMLQGIFWENIIIIHNVQFLIKKMKYILPYTGMVEVELLKIY